MRFPFFNRTPANGALRIPLPRSLELDYLVLFRAAADLPMAEAFPTLTRNWVNRNASDPLRTAATRILTEDRVRFRLLARGEFPEPPADFLKRLGGGEEELQRFAAATHAVHILVPDCLGSPHAGFWTAVAASRALAAGLSGVVLDPLIPRLQPVARNDESLPGDTRIRLSREMLIPQSINSQGLAWTTSKGLGRFGLPEIEVRDHPPAISRQVGLLVEGIAYHVLSAALECAAPDPAAVTELLLGPEVRITVGDVAGARLSDLDPPGMGAKGWTTVRLALRRERGAGLRLSLMPPQGVSSEFGVWLYSVMAELFGSEDTMVRVESANAAMEAAHSRAVAELPYVKGRFQKGLAPGEQLFVKVGFPTREEYDEYMWVAVSAWSASQLRGQLANDPKDRPDLKPGQTLVLQEGQIYDWMLVLRDGTSEGNYTKVAL